MKRSIFDTPAVLEAVLALEERARAKRRRPPTLREVCQIILKLDDSYPVASLKVAKELAQNALDYDKENR